MKKSKTNERKENCRGLTSNIQHLTSGITLVALVITVIVLIILAGITISLVIGDNGIIQNALRASEEYQKTAGKEELQLLLIDVEIELQKENRKINIENIYDVLKEQQAIKSIELMAEAGTIDVILENYPNYLYTIDDNLQINVVNENPEDRLILLTNKTLIVDRRRNADGTLKFLVSSEDGSNIKRCIIYIDNEFYSDTEETTITISGIEEGEHIAKIFAIDENGNVFKNKVIEFSYSTNTDIEKLDQYIFIDASAGDDTNGDGTENSPYKSLNILLQNEIIETGKTYGIMLNAGEYNLTSSMFNLNCDLIMAFIGRGKDTILNVSQIGANTSATGNTNYTLEFYKMVWKTSTSAQNYFNTLNHVKLYNIAFEVTGTYQHSFFGPRGDASITINNCTLPYNKAAFIRTTMTTGYIRLTNCYGGYNSGYNTSNSEWNYATNYITSSPSVDNDYRITQSSEVWKDVGTGKDNDGTIADLGVYGGKYSWDNSDIDIDSSGNLKEEDIAMSKKQNLDISLTETASSSIKMQVSGNLENAVAYYVIINGEYKDCEIQDNSITINELEANATYKINLVIIKSDANIHYSNKIEAQTNN